MTTGMQNGLKVLHDRLLAEKPEGAEHDVEGCPLCAMTDEGGTDEGKGGSVSEDKSFTQAELDAAVAQALEAKDARIRELEESAAVSDKESALAALRTEKEAEIADLQRQLDEATVTAAAEKQRADLIVAWLEDEQKLQEHAAEVAARKDERLAKLREVASFKDEYLEQNAERFAAMSDEDFAAHLDGLREVAAQAGLKPGDEPRRDTLPAVTGLHASRDETSAGRTSAAKALLAARREQGRIDYSTL